MGYGISPPGTLRTGARPHKRAHSPSNERNAWQVTARPLAGLPAEHTGRSASTGIATHASAYGVYWFQHSDPAIKATPARGSMSEPRKCNKILNGYGGEADRHLVVL